MIKIKLKFDDNLDVFAVHGVGDIIGSWLIILAVKKLVGLRVDPQDEAEGLDYATHGESSFHLGRDYLPGGSPIGLDSCNGLIQ